MHANQHIAGIDKVVNVLGYWPTFHDAEVVSFQAERALPVVKDKTVARMSVHVRHYETVGEGTANFEQVLRQSALINFVFIGACEFELSGFNHQNVINSIAVSPMQSGADNALFVDIDSIWGFGGTLQCSSVSVDAVDLPLNGAA